LLLKCRRSARLYPIAREIQMHHPGQRIRIAGEGVGGDILSPVRGAAEDDVHRELEA
jgi:hypothetical protein